MNLTNLHAYILGWAIIGGWAALALWALILRLAKREETPLFWRAVSAGQILLVVQLAAGLVLLALGHRPGRAGASTLTTFFHLLYGFGFPGIVLFFSHKWAREARYRPHTLFAIAGLLIFGLTLRGFMVGLVGV